MVAYHIKIAPCLDSLPSSFVSLKVSAIEISARFRGQSAEALCLTIGPVTEILDLVFRALSPDLLTMSMPLALLIHSASVHRLTFHVDVLHFFVKVGGRWDPDLFHIICWEPVKFLLVSVRWDVRVFVLWRADWRVFLHLLCGCMLLVFCNTAAANVSHIYQNIKITINY